MLLGIICDTLEFDVTEIDFEQLRRKYFFGKVYLFIFTSNVLIIILQENMKINIHEKFIFYPD